MTMRFLDATFVSSLGVQSKKPENTWSLRENGLLPCGVFLALRLMVIVPMRQLWLLNTSNLFILNSLAIALTCNGNEGVFMCVTDLHHSVRKALSNDSLKLCYTCSFINFFGFPTMVTKDKFAYRTSQLDDQSIPGTLFIVFVAVVERSRNI